MRYQTARKSTIALTVAAGVFLAGAVATVISRPLERGRDVEHDSGDPTAPHALAGVGRSRPPWTPEQFAAIWKRDLRALLIPPKTQPTAVPKQEPLVKLQHLGIAFQGGADPYAIIAGPDGRQTLVRTGTEPFPGVRVRRIGPRVVEIVQHGAIQRLELPFDPNVPTPAPATRPTADIERTPARTGTRRAPQSKPAAPLSSAASPPSAAPPHSASPLSSAAPLPSAVVPSPGRPTPAPAADTSFIHAARRDLARFFKDTKLEPVSGKSRSGAIRGFRITFIAPKSNLRQVGLRVGDVLTAIDGRPISSVTDTARLAHSLRSGKHAWLIERAGQHVTISIAD